MSRDCVRVSEWCLLLISTHLSSDCQVTHAFLYLHVHCINIDSIFCQVADPLHVVPSGHYTAWVLLCSQLAQAHPTMPCICLVCIVHQNKLWLSLCVMAQCCASTAHHMTCIRHQDGSNAVHQASISLNGVHQASIWHNAVHHGIKYSSMLCIMQQCGCASCINNAVYQASICLNVVRALILRINAAQTVHYVLVRPIPTCWVLPKSTLRWHPTCTEPAESLVAKAPNSQEKI